MVNYLLHLTPFAQFLSAFILGIFIWLYYKIKDANIVDIIVTFVLYLILAIFLASNLTLLNINKREEVVASYTGVVVDFPQQKIAKVYIFLEDKGATEVATIDKALDYAKVEAGKSKFIVDYIEIHRYGPNKFYYKLRP